MGLFGMHGWKEFVVFITALFGGLSLIIGLDAVNSAPDFMLNYYKYINDNPGATAQYPKFWAKVLTFYTVITEITQASIEPTNVTQFMCRFSLVSKLQAFGVLMIIELLILMLMPQTGVSEKGAVAGVVVAAFIGGLGRAYYENTTFATYGPCPSRHMTAVLVGSSVAGILASIARLILMGSMSSEYHSVLKQTFIYFSVSIAVIVIAAFLIIGLFYNSFAKQYIAELRSTKSFWANIYRPISEHETNAIMNTESNDLEDGEHSYNMENIQEKEQQQREEAEPVAGVEVANTTPTDPNAEMRVVTAKQNVGGEIESESIESEQQLPTSVLLQRTRLWPVIKAVYPLMGSVCLIWLITFMLYPGVLIAPYPNDDWFTVGTIAIFHFTDFLGRVITLIRVLWIPPRGVVIAAFGRLAFVPFIVACGMRKIDSKAFCYVLSALFGLTNGYFGALGMVYSPQSPQIKTHGERILAGQCSNLGLLVGVSAGSFLQLAIVLAFD